MFMNSVSSAAMERAYAGLWQRMQTITNNIANEDTPGYKAKRVSFEGQLGSELRKIQRSKTLSKKDAISILDNSAIEHYELGGTEVRADGNNVDIDNEHIELARTQLQYQLVQQKISGHYTSLKYVINGGR